MALPKVSHVNLLEGGRNSRVNFRGGWMHGEPKFTGTELGVWRPSPGKLLALSQAIFIVFHGIIKGKGLQLPGTNSVDKTLESPESTYKTAFLVLSRIWYKICTRAWSPFPLIIPWKTMKLQRAVGGGLRC